jgi:acetyl-CoA synthetase
MNMPAAITWQPDPALAARSHIEAIQRRLGVRDFDELHALSLADPDRYWRSISDYCQVQWTRPFDRQVDLSRGLEFPRWFVGGQLNWVDSVLAWAQRPETADRPAVIGEREDGTFTSVTFTELADEVRSFAAGLLALGIARGDRVGLLMEGGVEATVSLLAIPYIGAIVVPLFSGFGVDAIVSRLESSGARALIATTGFSRRGKWIDATQTMLDAKARLPALQQLIFKGEQVPASAGLLRWKDVAAAASAHPDIERMDPNDPFMVIYTSGTTGKPKGAVHCHGGFPLKVVHDSAIHLDAGPGDCFLWPVDMGWIGGAMVTGVALMRGAALVCYDGTPDFPDWSRMSRMIERHGVTHFGAAPTLIRGLASNPAQALQGEVSSLRVLVTAGEAIDPETFVWHQQAFGRGKAPLINFTGGTEASGALLSSVVTRPIRPAGFNCISPGVAADVVNAAGTPVRDEVGELAILRPFVGMTQSFWQDDERYLDTYWRTIPGMWVHSDLAVRTRDGHFFMRGRSDDTLKVAGKRLGPAEVEDVLLEMEDVAEAAAIGVDDAAKGQRLVIFVIAKAGAALADLERAVALHVEKRLGRPFRPASVHVVPDLPKTRTTKVMRRMIRSAYCGLPMGDVTTLANPDSLDAIVLAGRA